MSMQNLILVPELYCSDINVTKKFYTEIFGFKIKYERPEERFAYFHLGEVEIMVEEPFSDGRYWITGKLQKPYGRGVNFSWGVEELDVLYARILEFSPKSVYMEIENKSYACDGEVIVQRQFIAQDPDGYLFRFCSRMN